MATYRCPLVNNEFYHVFNRGVARMPTFLSTKDYEQAMLTLNYYSVIDPPIKLSRFKELTIEQRTNIFSTMQHEERCVENLSFVFMPNHFHFLLKQNCDNGITKFLSQFTNSYTRYFNTIHDRVGSLFQGVFKAVHIDNDEQLVHLSRYIHINTVVSHVIHVKDIYTYRWSSFPFYTSAIPSFVNTKIILDFFPNRVAYESFVLDQIDYGKELEIIKHLVIEEI